LATDRAAYAELINLEHVMDFASRMRIHNRSARAFQRARMAVTRLGLRSDVAPSTPFTQGRHPTAAINRSTRRNRLSCPAAGVAEIPQAAMGV
jgi:hypothetical protein